MKRQTVFLFAAPFLFSLFACGDVSPEQSSIEPEKSGPHSSEEAFSSEESSIVISSLEEGKDLYVSPTADDDGDGSKEKPYKFMAGVKKLLPGHTLWLLGGTYQFNTTQLITASKTAPEITDFHVAKSEMQRRVITPVIENGVEATVKFDFSAMDFNSSNRGVSLSSDYWTLRNIELFGAGDNGVYIGGNHNIVENIDVHDCQDSGVQVGRKSSSDNSIETWPSYNLIKNCTSHDNHDVTGEDSDGFACKLTTGVGNVFDGCIAYNNVDDGWDLYAKGETGPIGPVTIKNCIAFNNGVTSYGVGTANSDGNGFKLGGESIAVSHIVENCIAFNNLATGFTDNSNPGTIVISNCTSYNNGTRDLDANNFDMCRNADTSANVYKNLLSICDGDRISPIDGTKAKANSRDQFKGAADHCIFYSGLSMLKIGDIQEVDYTKSNMRGTIYAEPEGKSPFVSTLTPQVQPIGGVDSGSHPNLHKELRNADGSIKLGDFLKVNPDSEFAKLGEYGRPLGANLTGEAKQ